MKLPMKSVAAALIAAGGLAMTATSASAYVACNGEGQCWHVHRGGSYSYHPEWGVTVHPNSWRWGDHDRYQWHEHSGRGYWRNGAWVRF